MNFKPSLFANASKVCNTLMESGKTIWDKNGSKIMFWGGMGCAILGEAVTATKVVEASEILKREKEEKGEELTLKEKAKSTWKVLAPGIVISAVGFISMGGSFKAVETNGASALAAYKLSEMAKEEFKKSTEKVVGKNKVKKINEDIAAQKIIVNPAKDSTVINTGTGDILFKDPFDERVYFRASVDHVKNSFIKMKEDYYNSLMGEITVNDWYSYLNVGNATFGDYMVWDQDHPFEADINWLSDVDSEPLGYITFENDPVYKEAYR